MAKVPVPTLNHVDPVINRQTGHLKDAIDQLGSQTQDDWKDGTRFRRVTGVNFANQVTSSGIAPYSIVAANIGSGVLLGSNIAVATISGYNLAPLTVSGANLAAQTVTVDKLSPCNQFSVYRSAAQLPALAGVYTALFAESIIKDTANGYNAANGIYTIPSGGDWDFRWLGGISGNTNAGKEVFSALVINSGVVDGSVGWTNAASQTMLSNGSYLYCNARAGDAVKVQVWNGDSANATMVVGSGANYFQGYQLR